VGTAPTNRVPFFLFCDMTAFMKACFGAVFTLLALFVIIGSIIIIIVFPPNAML
jgi:hypothetical protein